MTRVSETRPVEKEPLSKTWPQSARLGLEVELQSPALRGRESCSPAAPARRVLPGSLNETRLETQEGEIHSHSV